MCTVYRLWVYVECRTGSAQVSAKAGAQRKQEERDVVQVTEYSVSCGLSLSLCLSVLCCEWSTWVIGVSTVLARNLYTLAPSLTKAGAGEPQLHEKCSRLTH